MIGRLADFLCSGRQRSRMTCIYIDYKVVKRTARGPGAGRLTQLHNRVANPKFGMGDAPIRVAGKEHFYRIKGLLKELDQRTPLTLLQHQVDTYIPEASRSIDFRHNPSPLAHMQTSSRSVARGLAASVFALLTHR